MVLLEAAIAPLAHAQLARHFGQLAVLVAFADQAIVGVVGDQELDNIAPDRLYPGRAGLDLLPVLGLQGAAGQQARDLLDLDQTNPAGRVRLACPIHGTQVGNGDARPAGGGEHGLARSEFNLFAVNQETHTQALSSWTRWMECLGQAVTQVPQPVHRSTTM